MYELFGIFEIWTILRQEAKIVAIGYLNSPKYFILHACSFKASEKPSKFNICVCVLGSQPLYGLSVCIVIDYADIMSA